MNESLHQNSEKPNARALEQDGFQIHESAVSRDILQKLVMGLDELATGVEVPGIRNLFRYLPILPSVLESPPIQVVVRAAVGPSARPVRAIYFDKTAARNWSVHWHQDRSIAVRKRVDLPGFGAWTVKNGIDHVEPPVRILERMVTIRIHIDVANTLNGGLSVIPGSHRMGRLDQAQVRGVTARRKSVLCAAGVGDVLAMKPLLLHASGKAVKPNRRRIIHVEYSPDDLPFPLTWFD